MSAGRASAPCPGSVTVNDDETHTGSGFALSIFERTRPELPEAPVHLAEDEATAEQLRAAYRAMRLHVLRACAEAAVTAAALLASSAPKPPTSPN